MPHSPKPPLLSMLKTVFLTSLLFTVPIVAGRFLGGFEGLELSAYDRFLQQRATETPDDRIVVMTIDDTDIETLQQYPIHDSTLAKALEKLVSYEPRAIGLDISRDVPQGPPDGRKRLAQVLQNNPSIISGCLLSIESHPGSPPAPGTAEGSVAFADFPGDRDGVVRRAKLLSTPGASKKPSKTQHPCNQVAEDNEIPSLSFLLAALYLEAFKITPQEGPNQTIRFGQTLFERLSPTFAGYAHGEVNDYQIMLNYRGGEQKFQRFSISQVLQNQVNPRLVRDRVVLVGVTSEVSKDFLQTPYAQTELGFRNMFGVLVHAHAVSQILSAVLDDRPLIHSWSKVAEIAWIWGWALGSGLIAFYTRKPGLFLLVVIGLGGALWGICYGLFAYQGLWIPFVPVLSALVLTAIGVRVVEMAERSGYAQAIAEQIREQLLNRSPKGSRGDYLERLVQRAKIARQGAEPDATAPSPDSAWNAIPPDMKALREEMEAKIRQELAEKQKVLHSAGNSGDRLTRMQGLLNRAQHSRKQTPPLTLNSKIAEQPLPEESND
ncbi:MAG: CHASE2 domain-containing protein [Leptolyngbyaceae cyanobacterium bins.59]|nr:CHASE2 domain-containing protein [Leptolyngbyaceae cyanobacterium bins.59]